MTLAEDPSLEVVTFESAGRDVTEAVLAFRDGWLAGREEHGLSRHCHDCGRSFPFDRAYCAYDGSPLRLTPSR